MAAWTTAGYGDRRQGVKLSGGQRQRAAAAACLCAIPELLVFDDLSSALDVDTERCCGNDWSRALAGPLPALPGVSIAPVCAARLDYCLKDGGRGEGKLEDLLETVRKCTTVAR